MSAVIALVGRPNVGKSTLFNRLTRSRDALVADLPGLTRDRQYGLARIDERACVVIDTGGLTGEEVGLDEAMARQTLRAVDEADLVLLMVDGRSGLTAGDEFIAERLRRMGRPVQLVVNKIDGIGEDAALAEFAGLGFGDAVPISASHGRGLRTLEAAVLARLPEDQDPSAEAEARHGIVVSVVGRPNVGKSTLVNRLLGEDRVVVYDEAGTTRDSIFIPYERDGRPYTLVDTAGVRRRGRVHETVEKFSVVKTLQAIDAAGVVVLVVDARDGLVEQDLHLLGTVIEHGRAIVLAVNKWDGMAPDERDRVRDALARRLSFIPWMRIHFISAMHGSGVGELYGSIDEAWEAACVDLTTHKLTAVLEDAVREHAPPLHQGRRIKLRYAHQGGNRPPVIVVHGNQTEQVPEAYRRFLERRFRTVFDLHGTPLRIELRSGRNPFAGRRNTLTPRQERKRKRLMKHIKKRSR
ncbi:MAG: ribosome biogenesis GTPase Der [Pseudomonadales bacterium]|jgi:GTP-binding protein|nr:ribosome biogenesis GTPase Der [Pseudomonadales bacterium]